MQRLAKNFFLLSLLIFNIFSLSVFGEEKAKRKEPINILRDVMQPIGVPVVSSYHTMRENVFLNTSRIGASGLEAIGDFFLAPSRYLFAGKTIIVADENNPTCLVEQSYSYKRLHWLKATLSLLALPVTETLGAAFKGLAYISPEIRKQHELVKTALKSLSLHSHLDEYKQKGISQFHCEDFIPCLGHKRPSQLTKRQSIEIETLKEITALLDQNNILYWIDCGTCLGAYRYGGIIPWDWDIDISILLPDHENVKKLLSHLDPDKYQIQDWSSYSHPKSFLKLYVKETKNFIDIYHYDIHENEKEVGYFFTFMDSPFPDSWKRDEMKCIKKLKYEDVFPLKKAQFDGLTVWAPNNAVTFLQSKYGENLEPSNVWDEEAQVYRKVLDHPYWKEE